MFHSYFQVLWNLYLYPQHYESGLISDFTYFLLNSLYLTPIWDAAWLSLTYLRFSMPLFLSSCSFLRCRLYCCCLLFFLAIIPVHSMKPLVYINYLLSVNLQYLLSILYTLIFDLKLFLICFMWQHLKSLVILKMSWQQIPSLMYISVISSVFESKCF